MQLDRALLCALSNRGILLGDTGAESRTLKERSRWCYLSFPDIAVKSESPNVEQGIEKEVERRGGPAA